MELGKQRLQEKVLQSKYISPLISVWAPAISQCEVNWRLLAGLRRPPEIAFSRHDIVLRMCFPLGQSPLNRLNLIELLTAIGPLFDQTQHAVGLHGPPSEAISSYQLPTLDLSDQQITHLGYLWSIAELMDQSVYLSALRSPP